MTILYLHGLNGSLIPEKRSVLERYGKVIAPNIDYENNPNCISWLYTIYKDKKIDLVMGSSLGGFTGYHLAKLLHLPALLFNPALAERSVLQNVPITPEHTIHKIHMVLGSRDSVVNPKHTLQFLSDGLHLPQDYRLHIRHDLEHRIPLEVFKEEVIWFMEGV